ncbi:hypothetical protein A9Q86_04070 [Flavobacteriales bacterium 33_180_T64]|nr:hypothetical protein A9Q86_04070 [Flavobacteriales bacterium 33_180_T64]
MNTEFKSRQLSFLVQALIFTAIVFGIHVYLVSYLVQEMVLIIPIWQIYVFHFVVTLLLISVINYKFSKGSKAIFNIFMIATFLKMILAILFLLPVLLSELENKQPDVFNFFIPYFLFLFFEVYSLTKFLQK